MTELLEKLKKYLAEHTILVGISLAVLVTIVLTLVSMVIYVKSDVSRLDISRPGYEKLRSSVVKAEDDKLKFEATGELGSAALRDFQTLFTGKRNMLGGAGRFDSDVLDDAQLKLTPASSDTTFEQ